MLRIAIIIGSTRHGGRGEAVAHWVAQHADKRDDAEFGVLDLAELDLPMFSEATPPGVLKNAIDHLYLPWHHEAAGSCPMARPAGSAPSSSYG